MRPIFMPARASARIAAWAPGPGEADLLPPGARTLTWMPSMPFSLAISATLSAALMAAYGEDSSLACFTTIPPVALVPPVLALVELVPPAAVPPTEDDVELEELDDDPPTAVLAVVDVLVLPPWESLLGFTADVSFEVQPKVANAASAEIRLTRNV